MSPKCKCSSKKEAEGDLIHTEGSVTMEAEIVMMQLQAKECWQLPEPGRGKD